jgi:hypothetical protein
MHASASELPSGSAEPEPSQTALDIARHDAGVCIGFAQPRIERRRNGAATVA